MQERIDIHICGGILLCTIVGLVYTYGGVYSYTQMGYYGVAMIGGLLKIIGLFRKRAL